MMFFSCFSSTHDLSVFVNMSQHLPSLFNLLCSKPTVSSRYNFKEADFQQHNLTCEWETPGKQNLIFLDFVEIQTCIFFNFPLSSVLTR